MRVNNSNGKYKGLTEDLFLGPLSPGLICKELLFLQMGHRYLKSWLPPSRTDNCESAPACLGSVPMTSATQMLTCQPVLIASDVKGRTGLPRQEQRAANALIQAFSPSGLRN